MDPIKIKITDWQKTRLVARNNDVRQAKALFDEMVATIIAGVVDPTSHEFDIQWKDNEITLTPITDG